MSKPTAIKDLDSRHVTDVPADVSWEDFSDRDEPYFYEATRCELCKGIIAFAGPDGNDRHDRLDSDAECAGHVPTVEGPMMSYAYPCDWEDGLEAARLLVDLPVIPVIIAGDRKALALTGGGMDLTWEICAAYIALGFLPPLHFASDLPRMAFPVVTERHRRTLAACERTTSVAAGWAASARRRVRDLRSEMLGSTGKGKARKGGK